MENRRWTLVRITGVAEIIIGIITLSLWLLTLIGDFFTGADLWFDILLSILFVPIFIFVIIAGKMTLQIKLLGRRINGILFWLLGILCITSIFFGLPDVRENFGFLPFDINIIPVLLIPLVLLLAYLLFHPKAKEQFK